MRHVPFQHVVALFAENAGERIFCNFHLIFFQKSHTDNAFYGMIFKHLAAVPF